MTAQLAIVDLTALADLRAEVAEIKAMLIGATVKPAPEWLSISEAAAKKKCSASTISRLIERGELESNGKTGKERKVKI